MSELDPIREIVGGVRKDNERYKKYFKHSDAAGILVGKINNTYLRSCSDASSIFIGASGEGKTSGPINDTVWECFKNGEIVIMHINGDKAEIYEAMAKEYGYPFYHLDTTHPEISDGFNTLACLYRDLHSKNIRKEKRMSIKADHISRTAIPDEMDKDDPFWPMEGQDLFLNCVKFLLENAPSEKYANYRSLTALLRGLSLSHRNNPFRDSLNYMDPKTNLVHQSLKSFSEYPSDTGNSIRAFCNGPVSFMNAIHPEDLERLFFRHTVNFETDLQNKKTGHKFFFLISNDPSTDTFSSPLSSILSYLISYFMDDSNKSEGYVRPRVNIIIDELSTLKPIADLEKAVNQGRKHDIRLILCCQSIKQLRRIYGKDEADSIVGGIQNQMYFRTSDFDTLDSLQKLCGDKILEIPQLSGSSFITAPVLSISDLRRFDRGRCLIFLGKNTYIWDFPPTFEREDYHEIECRADELKEEHKKKWQEAQLSENVLNDPNSYVYSWEDYRDAQEKQKAKEAEERNRMMNDYIYRSPDEAKEDPDIDTEFNGKSIKQIIAEIDAEIARLEAEEAAEKNALRQNTSVDNNPESDNENELGANRDKQEEEYRFKENDPDINDVRAELFSLLDHNLPDPPDSEDGETGVQNAAPTNDSEDEDPL